MSRFLELLDDERPHLFDGAMGTMLYQNGVFINRCYDEIVLKQPELVSRIHEQYVAAGAELIETNTFGANPVKLAEYSLEAQTHEINYASSRTARPRSRRRAPSSASRSTAWSTAASTSSSSRRSPIRARSGKRSAPCVTRATCRWSRR